MSIHLHKFMSATEDLFKVVNDATDEVEFFAVRDQDNDSLLIYAVGESAETLNRVLKLTEDPTAKNNKVVRDSQ